MAGPAPRPAMAAAGPPRPRDPRDGGCHGDRLRPRTRRGVPAAEEAERLAHLGPDLLGPDWDAEEAVRRLASAPDVPPPSRSATSATSPASATCSSTRCATCAASGPIGPSARSTSVPAVDLARRVIHANRDRLERTTTGDTRPGRRLWVYGREGEPCRRCGTRSGARLGRNDVELRETYWCPNCQP